MDRSGYVEVTVSTGPYERPFSVRVPLDCLTTREVFEPLEMSNDPLALMLHSFPAAKDYVKVRRQRVEFRGEVRRRVLEAVDHELEKAFGAQDKTNGYPMNGS